jgi:hypothetical protein
VRRLRRRIGLRSQTDKAWLIWAARLGYAACGFIYLVIGLVAIAVALGLGDEPTSSRGVMQFLARQPFAPLMLVALGIGLIGYAALNVTGAISDPERRGLSIQGLILRAVDIVTGALYVALAFAALGLLVGAPRHQNTAEAFAQKLLSNPFGSVLLGLFGLSLLISAVYLLLRAITEEFGHMLDRRQVSREVRGAISLAAKAGTAARAVVFAVCGAFSVRAALSQSPARVADVDDALAAIGSAAFGPVLLALMGVGFVAYGSYQLSKARYQRVIDVDQSIQTVPPAPAP